MIDSREVLNNLIQLIIMLPLSLYLLKNAPKTVNTTATYFMAGGMFCFFLGDLFWSLHIVLRGSLPPYFSASDVAWVGTWLFFLTAHLLFFEKIPAKKWPLWIAILPLFSLVHVVYWMIHFRNYFSDVVWAVVYLMMSLCAGEGLWRTIVLGQYKKMAPYYIALYLMIVIDLFLLSSRGTWLYVWMDLLITISAIMISLLFVRGGRP